LAFPNDAYELKEVYSVKLSTTTGNNITAISNLRTFLREKSKSELRKYTALAFFCADISTDCQGSDGARIGCIATGGGGPSYRPTLYSNNWGKGDDPAAGPYMQFDGWITLVMDELCDELMFNFAAWAATETHSGILVVLFYKLRTQFAHALIAEEEASS
jgi:hypothetical protein